MTEGRAEFAGAVTQDGYLHILELFEERFERVDPVAGNTIQFSHKLKIALVLIVLFGTGLNSLPRRSLHPARRSRISSHSQPKIPCHAR